MSPSLIRASRDKARLRLPRRKQEGDGEADLDAENVDLRETVNA